MDSEKIIFCFFIVLAMTLNLAFVYGDIDDLNHHHSYELFFAIVVNIIATILKFGDRTHMGSLLLATSLVANLQLIISAVIWTYYAHIAASGITESVLSSIVSYAAGALLANIVSVVLLVIETAQMRR